MTTTQTPVDFLPRRRVPRRHLAMGSGGGGTRTRGGVLTAARARGGGAPVAGEEGSGSWIARRALQAVAKPSDERGPKTALTPAACEYFQVAVPDDLATAIYAPTVTNDRIAGFSKQVIETARAGDEVARNILIEAGRELGKAAATVIRRLKMEPESFQAAFVGGVFVAGELVIAP